MAEAPGDDPFLWDVDRVVLELCTKHHSWQAPPAQKLPDPQALEASIREQEVNGEALLTYSEVFDKSSLWSELGIKKAPHKLSIDSAIKQFQKRSPGFRQWKRNRHADDHFDDDETHSALASAQEPAPKAHANGAKTLESPGAAASIHPPPLAVPIVELPLTTTDAPEESLDNDAALDGSVAGSSIPHQPPTKKRRTGVVNLSAPVHVQPPSIPNEGDEIHARWTRDSLTQKVNSAPANSSPAYLGRAAPASGLAVGDDSSDDELGEICWVRPSGSLPGRCIQVNKAMKRLLRSGPFVMSRVEPEDDEDEVLPLFGESDDEQSIDSETWNALERENKRKERQKAATGAAEEFQLRPEKVAETLERLIQQQELDWASNKKPRHDRKARKIWGDARVDPNREQMIRKLKADRHNLEERIERLKEEFLKHKWETESQLEELVPGNIGVSIDELQRIKMKLKLIESPHQPPRMAKEPGRAARRNRAPETSDEDEESIASDVNDSDSGTGSESEDLFVENHPTFDTMQVDGREADSPVVLRSQSPGGGAAPEAESKRSMSQSQPGSPLTVPNLKTEPPLPKTPRWALDSPGRSIINIPSSPMVISDTKKPPALIDVESIAELGVQYWQNQGDPQRLVIAALAGWSLERRTSVFDAIKSSEISDEVWERFIQPLVDNITPPARSEEVDTASLPVLVTRLFDCFVSCSAARLDEKKMLVVTLQRLRRYKEKFRGFCSFLIETSSYFLGETPRTPKTRIKLISRSGSGSQESPIQLNHTGIDDGSEEEFSSESSEEDTLMSAAKGGKRKRKPARDKVAENLRLATVIQKEENEKRRQLLRASGAVPSDKSRLIVNETKNADDSLIYINDEIGSKIKDHQIEGVRFLWDHIVHSPTRQGCLLAHAMGLGKTMQAITLLVVIAEAADSDDPSVRSQIPEDLWPLKVLVLCPSGLVDNWFEEIGLWGLGALVRVWKLGSQLKIPERIAMVKQWATEGGILLIGYELFTAIKTDEDLGLSSTLEEAPNIVIADEAHKLKNSKSERHRASSSFKTMSRIALTGSPLTTNVMDYYAMINWVAPGYLAGIDEFRNRFEGPIKDGLYSDSDPTAKRKARKMLHILKETVAPKVNRKDVQVLLDTLPGKKEFIITVPLTEVQMKAYQAYLDMLRNPSLSEQVEKFKVGNSTIWSLVSLLSRLLAHPQVFKVTMEKRKKKSLEDKQKSRPNSDSSTKPRKFLDQVRPEHLSELLATISGLKDISDIRHSYKMQVLFEILDECKKARDKVLVFSQCILTLDFLAYIFNQQMRNFSRLDGKTKPSDRQKAVKKFNNDIDAEIYLISTNAGGVGLNIYGANRVVIFDFKYTPTEEQQAIGRAYRIGQTKTVFVYWLTAGGTFEAAIHNNAVFKTQLASRVVDKKNPDPYANKAKSEYFKPPTIPPQENLAGIFNKDKVLDAVLRSERIQGVVRNVITTETFEKEEVFELSAEDKLEAERDIALEKLRISNPEEYNKERLKQLSSGSGIGPPPSSAPLTSLTNPLPSFQPPAPASRPTPGPREANMSSHMPPPSTAPSAMPPLGQQRHTDPVTFPSGSPGRTSKKRELEPILGSGTGFKHTSKASFPSSSGDGLEAQLVSFESAIAASLHEARERLPLGKPTTAPEHLLSSIRSALDNEACIGLPRADFVQGLRACAKKPRFAEALLAGYLTPEQLVKMDRPKLIGEATRLSNMDETAFKNVVWGSAATEVGVKS
ncbi:hypothetical protein B0T16DRAFT_428974 [Cercophora newfieldiana]|uniref:Uncharacterized protein n=1 Tax=Cercophora newfieldiana TaxID=92897 RepID=A0AA40CP34_9PEZI|nr:hypothetical protein B0T16DRAFT_428974 [Cercophora newfieldiana]